MDICFGRLPRVVLLVVSFALQGFATGMAQTVTPNSFQPSVAEAQSPAPGQPNTSTEQLASIDPGHAIEAVRSDGSRISGRFVRVSGNTLIVEVAGSPLEMPIDALHQVAKVGDSVKDGASHGLAIGALVGLVGGVVLVSRFTESDDRAASGRNVLLSTLMGAGIGLGVGAACDGLVQGRTVVFPMRSAVRIAPILGEHRKGVLATLRY